MIKTVKQGDKLSGKLTAASLEYQKSCPSVLKESRSFPSAVKYNLTIGKDKKFVWFRVAKVATRTIFNALAKADVQLEAEHTMRVHYPYLQYRNHFKFALVRNPFDRLVSCWKNKVLDNNYFNFSEEEWAKMKEFENFVTYVESKNIMRCDHHFRSQSRLIDLNNIDFLGRFERLDKDLPFIMNTLGIDQSFIQHRNKSKEKADYRSFYDTNLVARVEKIYEKDLNIFNYDF